MNSRFVETETDSLKFQDSNRRLGCWERLVESSRPLLFYLVSEPQWTWQASPWNNRLPRWLSGKESACQYRRHRRHGFDPWVGKIPLRRKWQPTPLFLPGKVPWTEKPGGLQSMMLQQSWTQLSMCWEYCPKQAAIFITQRSDMVGGRIHATSNVDFNFSLDQIL